MPDVSKNKNELASAVACLSIPWQGTNKQRLDAFLKGQFMSKAATKSVDTALVRYLEPNAKREKKQVAVDAALEEMIEKYGTVTVDIVLKESRNASHPLHHWFVWDNKIAGEKFRRMQAYAMILSSKFTVQLVQQDNSHVQVLKSARVRRLVNSFNGEGFKLRTDALKKSEDREAIIEKKKSVLRSWCQSVIDIEELTEIRESIEAKIN